MSADIPHSRTKMRNEKKFVAVAGLEPATSPSLTITSLSAWCALPTELYDNIKARMTNHAGTFNLSIQYISFDFSLTA